MVNYIDYIPRYTFYYLFKDFHGLVDASQLELPIDTVSESGYDSMFKGCSRLTKAPKLPATNLETDNCYSNMFYGCTSLVEAPELPATTLVNYCYQRMFYGCTSLVNAPKLAATTLAEGCCQYMFYGCTSLVEAPELPAITLTTSLKNCYTYMFYKCSKLTKIVTKHTGRWHILYTDYWVKGVSATGTFYKLTALPEEYGTYKIPEGWTVVNID